MKEYSTPINVCPPKLLDWLLEKVVPDQQKDALLGDLHEEFTKRATVDTKLAASWYRYQVLRTLLHYSPQVLGSQSLLKYAVILFTAMVLPIIFVLVAWLSNLDETTPVLWELLLAGEMHNIVIKAAFWSAVPESLWLIDDLQMYISIKSLAWSCACLGLLLAIHKRRTLNVHQVALFGYTLMLLPYVLGIIFLAMFDLDPRQIGPLLAFILFNIFYMTLPVSLIVIKGCMPVR